MAADLTSGSRVALRAGPDLDHRRTSAGRSFRTSCSSSPRTSARSARVSCGRTPTASCPTTRASRNEGFGKLTYTPVGNVLINATLSRLEARRDQRRVRPVLPSDVTGSGSESRQRIATGEASWVINSRSHFSGGSRGSGSRRSGGPTSSRMRRSTRRSARRSTSTRSTRSGRFTGPRRRSPNNAAQTAFVQPLIQRYGYVDDTGVRTGGGIVGYGSQFDDNDFYRTEAKIGYNLTFGSGNPARPPRRVSVVHGRGRSACAARTAGG